MSKTPSKTPELSSAPAQAPTPPAIAAEVLSAVPAVDAGASRPEAQEQYRRRTGLDSHNVDYDTPSQDIDHSRVRDTGIALSDVRGIETEPTLGSVKQALDNERFMADVLEVTLADPGDEHEHQYAEITVNGERICIKRGDTAQMKRCHLAVLAGAKVQRVVQTKVTAADGSMGYEEKFVLRPVYPFQVMYDPAGQRGSSWLRQILQRG